MIKSIHDYCRVCGSDISSRRADAQYCSDRCRMRYRRLKQKNGLIKQLAQIFTQLPNHSAHYAAKKLNLQYREATSGNVNEWSHSELQAMSISALNRLLRQKRMLFAGSSIINLLKK